ncbi:MAG: pantoate--beta-alanine ligase [Candidatus Omnitrophica bacterium]|nr:pantoate--beta-alanine ligase [Candidatus Omnitrophota bacterium]
MKVITGIKKMQLWNKGVRKKGETIGFVPTMGYLHQGHLSLMRRAKKENDRLVVSIFVNPTQFGPGEDFKRYPRNFKRDQRLSRACGADVIFHPQAKKMYPPDFKTYVEVGKLGERLCGRSRPGHFRGVTTIVNKLFNIVQPDTAYFGQKDAQQAIIISRMAQDLNLPLKIKVLPIVREKDGLAMSSRNTYLSADARKNAIILYKSLQTAVGMIQSGYNSPREIIFKMREMINSKPGAKIDYIKIVDARTLKEVKRLEGRLLIAVAVYFNKTRLIDNKVVQSYKRKKNGLYRRR